MKTTVEPLPRGGTSKEAKCVFVAIVVSRAVEIIW